MAKQKLTTLDPDLFIEYSSQMTDSLIIDAVAKRINKPNMSILDVGGASGIILNQIMVKSRFKLKACIMDMFPKYKKNLVNKNINFIIGSIVRNNFKPNQFDFVIFRDVLHHIIVGGIKEIQKNQQKAIEEMIRITKRGGFIIFEEEINNSKLSSRILFYLSNLANSIGIGNLNVGVGKVVISFMGKEEIENVLKKNDEDIKVLKRKFIRWNFPALWDATTLFRKFYRAFYIVKKLN